MEEKMPVAVRGVFDIAAGTYWFELRESNGSLVCTLSDAQSRILENALFESRTSMPYALIKKPENPV